MTQSDVLERLASRPWRGVEAPARALAIPTMLSPQEQALLYWLARDYASGGGAIVDAGSFLGGSSAALLAGLEDRKEPWNGPPLVSYDRFLVEEYTIEQYFSDADVRLGDSFRRFYDRNVSGFDAPHAVREGDIVQLGWSGEPIEVLFLDVLKSWEVNDAVLRDFFPHVIPGQTVLVHQDYVHAMLPWIHITVELMRDSLRLVDEMPYGSQVFLVEKPVDPALLRTSTAHDIDDAAKVELIDRAVEANDGEAREMVLLAKALLLHELGERKHPPAMVNDIDSRTTFPAVKACAARILEAFARDAELDGRRATRRPGFRHQLRRGLHRLRGR